MYQNDLPHRAVTVYMYLADRANEDGTWFPSISTIARELKISKSTVKRALVDLEKVGFIERENRFRQTGAKTSNLYYLKSK